MRQVFLWIQVSLADVPAEWLRWVTASAGTRESMQQTFQMQIAASIALAIERAGFRTQDEFAHVIGMDRSTLRRVLSGNFDPKLSTLQRIALGLETTVDALLTPVSTETTTVLKKRGRKTPAPPQMVQIQFLLAPGEELPAWLKEAILGGKASQVSTNKGT